MIKLIQWSWLWCKKLVKSVKGTVTEVLFYIFKTIIDFRWSLSSQFQNALVHLLKYNIVWSTSCMRFMYAAPWIFLYWENLAGTCGNTREREGELSFHIRLYEHYWFQLFIWGLWKKCCLRLGSQVCSPRTSLCHH